MAINDITFAIKDFTKELRTTDNRQPTTGKNGFTLVEIIIAVLLLAIAIAPMVNAYAPAIFSTSGEEEMAVFSNRVRGTLNRTVVLDFGTLNSNQGNPVDLAALFGSADEAAKETFSFQGKSYTPTVSISDASDGPGGLLEVTVTIHHVSLKTLKAEY
ncbi:MAG: type II secretion system protein [Desulfobacterales bacterium]|nr:type II secretion system protein [Desulfobacterales bacterium]